MNDGKIRFFGHLYLHLGFPKTGTMALQNEIIPEMEGAYYLGMSAKIKSLNTYRDLTFNLHPHGSSDSKFLQEDLKKIEANGYSKVLVSHVYPTNPDNLIKIENISHFLDLLDERIEDYSLIFTVRKPSKLVESLYLHEHNGLDIGKFDSWFISQRIQHFLKFLNYSDFYHETRIRGIPLLFLKQEDLSSSRKNYIKKLIDFMAVSFSDAIYLEDLKPHLRQSELMKFVRINYRRLPKFLRIFSLMPNYIKHSVEKMLNLGPRQSVKKSYKAEKKLKLLDNKYENSI